MDGIAQGAKDGGALMSRDGRVDFCSCKIDTSTFRGGRIAQGAKEGGALMSKTDSIA